MTITEAQAVNMVLEHALGLGTTSPDRAREEAAFLADRAHKKLSAGLSGEKVRAAWPDRASAS